MPEYAVIIEEDYKGMYSRYALTTEEFEREYRHLDDDIPEPTVIGDSYTLRPLVHIWYRLVETNSDVWKQFFTNMFWELPESDVENDNPAYVALDNCLSLRNIVERTIDERN